MTDQSEDATTSTGGNLQGSEAPLGDAIAAVDWLAAVIAGILGAVLGYVLLAAVFVLGPASFGAISSTVEQVRQLGLLFYNAHFVDLVASVSEGAAVAGGRRINIITESAGQSTVPIVVYLLVPVVTLVAVGLVATARRGDGEWIEAAGTGVGMAVGYVLVLLPATVLVTRSGGGSSISPDLLQTVALGLGYPLVLGTVGAAVGVALARRAG